MYDNDIDNQIQNINFHITKADDAYIYSDKKQKILDFSTGLKNIFGYSNFLIEKEIINQIHKGYFNCKQCFNLDCKKKLEDNLCKISGFVNNNKETEGIILFSQSITEANENAIKIVRTRYNELCDRKYNEIICIKNSNYGSSIATISANNDNSVNFNPLLRGFQFAETNNILDIEKLITEHTSAIFIESVQIKDKITTCEKAFILKIREICTYHKIGLIIDETSSDNYRTGETFFFHQKYNIKPDIIISTNGLYSFPLAYCIVNKEYSNFITEKMKYHNNTSILSFNITNKIFDKINSKSFITKIDRNIKILNIALKQLTIQYPNFIKSVNIVGLIFCIELQEYVNYNNFIKLLTNNGLLFNTTKKNSIILIPPLTINETHIIKAYHKISKTIKQMSIIEAY